MKTKIILRVTHATIFLTDSLFFEKRRLNVDLNSLDILNILNNFYKVVKPQNKKIKSMTEIGIKYTVHKDIWIFELKMKKWEGAKLFHSVTWIPWDYIDLW